MADTTQRKLVEAFGGKTPGSYEQSLAPHGERLVSQEPRATHCDY